MGATELSKKLKYHPATISRILQILNKKGFLRQDEKTRKFMLGSAANKLGKGIFTPFANDLLLIAKPYLRELSELLGETVVLQVVFGDSAVCVDVVQGTRGLSIRFNPGDRIPVHVSPGGKVILSYYDPEDIDKLFSRGFQSFTHKTITDLDVFKRELQMAREQGVAFGREEATVGVNAIGVPVLDPKGIPIAAVLVVRLASKVEYDLNSPEIVSMKKIADEIGRQIGLS